MVLRFPPGLREAFDAVLKAGENRTNVLQGLVVDEVVRRGGQLPEGLAVEAELARRAREGGA